MKALLKKNRSTILLLAVFFTGLSVLLYPAISNYINSRHQSRVIADYTERVENMPEEQYEEILEEARAYNASLADGIQEFKEGEPKDETYKNLLDINGEGMMGYIVIEKLGVRMPVYHGTADDILGSAAGHLEGSSLPVGGEGTHAVLTGHRGLPSSRLFTDLDKMEEGDTFTLYILNEALTYQVDQIRIVEPDETDDLRIEPGEDYCTLVTCTPYGINTHRMLVRGTRISAEESASAGDLENAVQIEPVFVASVLTAAFLVIFLVVVLIRTRKKKKRKRTGREEKKQ